MALIRAQYREKGEDPDILVGVRAQAEIAAGRHAEAIAPLEEALRLVQSKRVQTWNEAYLLSALFNSHLKLNRRDEALKWGEKAVTATGGDPQLLFTYLSLVVEKKNVVGLAEALPKYANLKQRLDVRTNATLCTFEAWLALAQGQRSEARKMITKAGANYVLALKNGLWTPDELVTWTAILRVVFSGLGETAEMAAIDSVAEAPTFPMEAFRQKLTIFALGKPD